MLLECRCIRMAWLVELCLMVLCTYRLPVVDKGKSDAKIDLAVALHRKTIMSRVLKQIIQHRKLGHRPAGPDNCGGCGLNMTRKPATRLEPTAQRHVESRRLIAGVDYVTGPPVGNDGNTAVLGVVMASRRKGQPVAWYHPVKSHSGDGAIAASKECDFRLSLMFSPGESKLARVHSGCGLPRPPIGTLREHLKGRQMWPTQIEGYGHNENAVVESRNKVLLKGLTCPLSTAAGRALSVHSMH